MSPWDAEAAIIRAARDAIVGRREASAALDRLIAEERRPIGDRIAELRLEGKLPVIRRLELRQLEAAWKTLGGRSCKP